MNVTELRAKAARVLADHALDTEAEPQSYSGRAMYGRRCLGIVGSESELFSILLRAAVELAQDPEYEDLNPDDLIPRRDSMGLDQVWYWPSLPAPEEDV